MTGGSRIRVMIVDDSMVVHKGIEFSLLALDDMELVGGAESGEEALCQCREVQPDVILMDMAMPGMDGVATTRAILERYPGVRVIALTGFEEGDLVQKVLQAGAIGYLLKDMAIDELADAIRSACAGRFVLASAAAQALAQAAAQPPEMDYNLTKRQREVLALIVEGLSNGQIAERLTISLSMARSHVSTILSKLGAANRAEAAALAVKHRLLVPLSAAARNPQEYEY